MHNKTDSHTASLYFILTGADNKVNKPTPCSIDDKCHDCMSPERICRALTVLWMPINGMETEIVLIDEELGM